MITLDALDKPPNSLFWSEPLAVDSDFKKEDPLALDYLGQQVGLWLFPGFTTRTNRAQYYAVVLYGLHLADVATKKYGYAGNAESRTQLFERWERFWALATLEFKNGALEQGDEDAMRGVRGATRAWKPRSKLLPLDFPLISRQSELGGLGAYLSSLREYGLVSSDSLRPTPAAQRMLECFWSEKGKRNWSHLYESYALKALELKSRNIARSSGRLTLSGLGRRSRLSSLVQEARTAQQKRLWNALFISATDNSTLPLARQLVAAHEDGVDEAQALLEAMHEHRWGQLPPEVDEKVQVALAFGRLAREILQRFDLAYGYLDEHGWVADFDTVARACFPNDRADGLRSLCNAMLSVRGVGRFRALRFHGPGFLALVENLISTDSTDSLAHLLAFHREVQRSRRGGGAWLRSDQEKLVLQVAGYNGHKSEPDFPGFKLNVVRRLLADLGKLAR